MDKAAKAAAKQFAEKDQYWLTEWRFEVASVLKGNVYGKWRFTDEPADPAAAEWDALRFAIRTKYGDKQLFKVKLVCNETTTFEKVEV